jgi:hypothetical protein
VQASTADRGRTVKNQLQPLQEAAEWLGWVMVRVVGGELIRLHEEDGRRPSLDRYGVRHELHRHVRRNIGQVGRP